MPKQRNNLPQGWIQHGRALTWSLQQLRLKPITSLLCVLVIGIALALPFTLGWAVHTTNRLHPAWAHGQQLSLYLKPNASQTQAHKLSDTLNHNTNVTSAHYISPQQGLAEFKQQTGLTEALSALVNNPLPGVITIEFPNQLATDQVLALQQQLAHHPLVATAKADISWLRRFQATTDLVSQIGQAFAMLLSLAIILIISNVIGMIMSTHQDQTTLLKLLGASRSYMRRPLLYLGSLIGLFSAGIAWSCIQGMLWWLKPSLQAFTQNFQLPLSLFWLDWRASLLLISSGTLLGLLSAYFASYRLCQTKLKMSPSKQKENVPIAKKFTHENPDLN